MSLRVVSFARQSSISCFFRLNSANKFIATFFSRSMSFFSRSSFFNRSNSASVSSRIARVTA
jgi:hypothetical protein